MTRVRQPPVAGPPHQTHTAVGLLATARKGLGAWGVLCTPARMLVPRPECGTHCRMSDISKHWTARREEEKGSWMTVTWEMHPAGDVRGPRSDPESSKPSVGRGGPSER